ncbi:hypothetical protein [Streptomyces roseolus]|uniref:hypothetical protein n=1 Tax=Streptomyces roseolus TaxID=67358 RepID=UPI0016734201|nr:hypothetical protein [Streptomyces roseolus]
MDLRQEEMLGRFTSMEQGSWTTVYESWHERNENGGIYCAFAPTAMRTRILESPSWDVSMGDFRPGFSQHRENGEIVTRYFRSSTEDGIEPLVLCREYHGAVPSTRELTEHFRLYHNLYWDELGTQFMQPLDDGTSLAAVKVTASRIEVRTKLLRQFQAAQGYDLILYMDSVRIGEKDDTLPEALDLTTDTARISLYPGDRIGTGKFTRLLGTRVVPPPPIEKSGIWPFEEEDSHYPDFIIATRPDGDEIRYSCNPDSLSNYFGANPDAPNYLTPVYFRREVLQKYYEKPELYTVSDGYLNCASLWSLRLDNSAQDYIIVFLGDLGRDLPRQERDSWRSFNVAEDGPPSETLIRRAFLGQPSEPTAEDLLTRSNYVTFRRTWEEVYGWELFRKPEEADTGLLQRLRLPLNDSQAEFESAIRIMTQLFVDALNEREIQKRLPDRIDNEKGISKLKRWLDQEGYPHADRDTQFLRNLQEIRSKATAHRKSSDYEKTLTKVFGDLRGPAAVKTFFTSALSMLTGLSEWASEPKPQQE